MPSAPRLAVCGQLTPCHAGVSQLCCETVALRNQASRPNPSRPTLGNQLFFHKEQISHNFDGEEDGSSVYGGMSCFARRLQVTWRAMQTIECSPGYVETRFDMKYSIETGIYPLVGGAPAPKRVAG